MKSFYEKEAECALAFSELGECWHLSTSENFEIIFTSDQDFRSGMGTMAVCSRLFPDIRILTFELMSNHIHITAATNEDRLVLYFETLRKMLSRQFQARGRTVDLQAMTYIIQELDSLEKARNTIAYDNRNGYIVNPNHTPFTYPWGANRFYFNPDAKKLAVQNARKMPFQEIRSISHTHKTDRIKDILCFEGCAIPIDFCTIESGERLFRNASHYFYLISKNIEAKKQIAKEIGENVFYTDNELFSAISKIANDKYGTSKLTETAPQVKLELARIMRFEYNASSKQIIRFLKLSKEVLASIGIN